MKTKPHSPTFLSLSAAAVVTVLLSGCGSQPYTSAEKKTLRGYQYTGSGSTALPTGSSSTGNTTSATGVLPLTFRVEGVGYTSETSFVVRANRVLKIKFSPGIVDANPSGTGYTTHYSGLGVYINVGSASRSTALLDNGLFSGKAETSDAMDFSGSIQRSSCPASDTTCREDVTITITKPNSNFWCLNYASYCPWTHMPDSLPWNGTLTVQTDDTDAI